MRSLENLTNASRYNWSGVSRHRVALSLSGILLIFLFAVILVLGWLLYTTLDLYQNGFTDVPLPPKVAFAFDDKWLDINWGCLGAVALLVLAVAWLVSKLLFRRRLKALLQATQQLQELLKLQIDHMPIGCILTNTEFDLIGWNPSAEKIFGFTQSEVLGRNFYELFLPSARLDKGELASHGFNENVTKDGRTIICEWYNTPLKKSDGTAIGNMAMVQDVTDRQRAELALRESERRYHTLAQVSPVGIFHIDVEGCLMYVNDQWCRISGLTIEESLGQVWTKTLHPEDRERVILQWFMTAKQNLPFQSEYRLQRPDGVITWVYAQALAEMRDDGELVGYISTIVDITKRKQVEEQLREQAFYDRLTDLPKRTFFLEGLGKLLQRGQRDKVGLFAVILLQLERFQIIKYSLGHSVADELVVATAERLKACLRPIDMAARMGWHEFAILLSDLNNVADATNIADEIYQQLNLPFNLNKREVFVSASMGIALGAYGSDPVDGSDLPEYYLRAAETAMHQAKKVGNLPYAVFEPAMHTSALERLQLDTDLRRAIERQELQVYYQPIVSLSTGYISGFEALLRWLHPKRGMISPVEFIPVAEETGLIISIGRWVLIEACRQLSIWQERFPTTPPLTMSVNISGVQFRQAQLIEEIDQILQETGIAPNSLKLEITETVVMENAELAIALLEQMKLRNIRLGIDDFGTGYSSLSYLHRFPVDTLKIDRSFVTRMGTEGENLEIVRAIATLAQHLGMDTIAEGVETAEQLAQLRALSCEYGQGYFFSCPVDSLAAGQLLAVFWQW